MVQRFLGLVFFSLAVSLFGWVYAAADVWVNVTADKVLVQSGDLITYTMIYGNSGDQSATNVLITGSLASGLSLVYNPATFTGTVVSTAQGTQITWSGSTWVAGFSGFYVYTAVVTNTFVSGPTSFRGLKGWYDASNTWLMTLSGGQILTWSPRVGDYPLSGLIDSGTSFPTVWSLQQGLKTVSFNWWNYLQSVANFSAIVGDADRTLAAFLLPQGLGSRDIGWFGTYPYMFSLRTTLSSTTWQLDSYLANLSGDTLTAYGSTPGTRQNYVVSYSGQTRGASVYRNGALQSVYNNGTLQTPGTAAYPIGTVLWPLTLGRTVDSSVEFVGLMSEFLVYDKVLGNSAAADLSHYLAAKWLGDYTHGYVPALQTTISSSNDAATGGNNFTRVVTDYANAADFVTTGFAPVSVSTNAGVPFAVTYFNTGRVMTDVTVSLTWDKYLTYSGAHARTPAPDSITTTGLTRTISSVAPGQGGTVSGLLYTSGNFVADQIQRTAQSRGPYVDASPSDNIFTGVIKSQSPDLSITKTVDKKIVTNGQNFTYSLTIANNGVATGTAIQVDDRILPGLDLVAIDLHGLSANLGTGIYTFGTKTGIRLQASGIILGPNQTGLITYTVARNKDFWAISTRTNDWIITTNGIKYAPLDYDLVANMSGSVAIGSSMAAGWTLRSTGYNGILLPNYYVSLLGSGLQSITPYKGYLYGIGVAQLAPGNGSTYVGLPTLYQSADGGKSRTLSRDLTNYQVNPYYQFIYTGAMGYSLFVSSGYLYRGLESQGYINPVTNTVLSDSSQFLFRTSDPTNTGSRQLRQQISVASPSGLWRVVLNPSTLGLVWGFMGTDSTIFNNYFLSTPVAQPGTGYGAQPAYASYAAIPQLWRAYFGATDNQGHLVGSPVAPYSVYYEAKFTYPQQIFASTPYAMTWYYTTYSDGSGYGFSGVSQQVLMPPYAEWFGMQYLQMKFGWDGIFRGSYNRTITPAGSTLAMAHDNGQSLFLYPRLRSVAGAYPLGGYTTWGKAYLFMNNRSIYQYDYLTGRQATIVSAESDANPTNNTSRPVYVDYQFGDDIGVTGSTLTPGSGAAGSAVLRQINWVNNGPDRADIGLELDRTPGISFGTSSVAPVTGSDAGSPLYRQWLLTGVAKNASGTLFVTGYVVTWATLPSVGWKIFHRTGTDIIQDSFSGNDVITGVYTVGVSDVSVTVTNSTSPTNMVTRTAGRNNTFYTVTFMNSGNAISPNTIVKLFVSTGQVLGTGTISTGAGVMADDTLRSVQPTATGTWISWPVGDVDAGGSGVIVLSVTSDGRSFGRTPGGLSGLNLWLDADDKSTLWQDLNGTLPVISWSRLSLRQDKSHLRNDAINNDSQAINKPIYRPFASAFSTINGCIYGGTYNNGATPLRSGALGVYLEASVYCDQGYLGHTTFTNTTWTGYKSLAFLEIAMQGINNQILMTTGAYQYLIGYPQGGNNAAINQVGYMSYYQNMPWQRYSLRGSDNSFYTGGTSVASPFAPFLIGVPQYGVFSRSGYVAATGYTLGMPGTPPGLWSNVVANLYDLISYDRTYTNVTGEALDESRILDYLKIKWLTPYQQTNYPYAYARATVSNSSSDANNPNNTSRSYLAYNDLYDLALTGPFIGTVYSPGNTIGFTFILTNTGRDDFYTDTIRLGTVPGMTGFVSSYTGVASTTGYLITGGIWLPAGSSVTLIITGQILSGSTSNVPSSIPYTGSVSIMGSDQNSGNNLFTGMITVGVPDLWMTGSVPVSMHSGQIIQYTYTLGNSGTAGASGASVDITLMTGLQILGSGLTIGGAVTPFGEIIQTDNYTNPDGYIGTRFVFSGFDIGIGQTGQLILTAAVVNSFTGDEFVRSLNPWLWLDASQYSTRSGAYNTLRTGAAKTVAAKMDGSESMTIWEDRRKNGLVASGFTNAGVGAASNLYTGNNLWPNWPVVANGNMMLPASLTGNFEIATYAYRVADGAPIAYYGNATGVTSVMYTNGNSAIPYQVYYRPNNTRLRYGFYSTGNGYSLYGAPPIETGATNPNDPYTLRSPLTTSVTLFTRQYTIGNGTGWRRSMGYASQTGNHRWSNNDTYDTWTSLQNYANPQADPNRTGAYINQFAMGGPATVSPTAYAGMREQLFFRRNLTAAERSGIAMYFDRKWMLSGTWLPYRVYNSVTISSPLPDISPANNTFRDYSEYDDRAELSVATNVVTGAQPGDTVPFVLTVTNSGRDTIPVSVAFTFPAGMTYQGPTPVSVSGNLYQYQIASLAAGQSATIVITGQVGVWYTSSHLDRKTMVSSIDTDTNTGDNCNTGTILVSLPDVQMTVGALQTGASYGDLIGYTITYANSGTATGQNTQLALLLSGGLRMVSATLPEISSGIMLSGQQVVRSLGDLAPGSSWSLVLTAAVASTGVTYGTPLTGLTTFASAGSFTSPITNFTYIVGYSGAIAAFGSIGVSGTDDNPANNTTLTKIMYIPQSDIILSAAFLALDPANNPNGNRIGKGDPYELDISYRNTGADVSNVMITMGWAGIFTGTIPTISVVGSGASLAGTITSGVSATAARWLIPNVAPNTTGMVKMTGLANTVNFLSSMYFSIIATGQFAETNLVNNSANPYLLMGFLFPSTYFTYIDQYGGPLWSGTLPPTSGRTSGNVYAILNPVAGSIDFSPQTIDFHTTFFDISGIKGYYLMTGNMTGVNSYLFQISLGNFPDTRAASFDRIDRAAPFVTGSYTVTNCIPSPGCSSGLVTISGQAESAMARSSGSVTLLLSWYNTGQDAVTLATLMDDRFKVDNPDGHSIGTYQLTSSLLFTGDYSGYLSLVDYAGNTTLFPVVIDNIDTLPPWFTSSIDIRGRDLGVLTITGLNRGDQRYTYEDEFKILGFSGNLVAPVSGTGDTTAISDYTQYSLVHQLAFTGFWTGTVNIQDRLGNTIGEPLDVYITPPTDYFRNTPTISYHVNSWFSVTLSYGNISPIGVDNTGAFEAYYWLDTGATWSSVWPGRPLPLQSGWYYFTGHLGPNNDSGSFTLIGTFGKPDSVTLNGHIIGPFEQERTGNDLFSFVVTKATDCYAIFSSDDTGYSAYDQSTCRPRIVPPTSGTLYSRASGRSDTSHLDPTFVPINGPVASGATLQMQIQYKNYSNANLNSFLVNLNGLRDESTPISGFQTQITTKYMKLFHTIPNTVQVQGE